MTRTTAYRVITNARPHDYRSGIEPMVEPLLWRKTVATTALLAVGAYAVGFALWGLG